MSSPRYLARMAAEADASNFFHDPRDGSDRDDDNNSAATTPASREREEVKAVEQAFQAETNRVRLLRTLVALTFMGTATAVVVRTFRSLRHEEDESFQAAVRAAQWSGLFKPFRRSAETTLSLTCMFLSFVNSFYLFSLSILLTIQFRQFSGTVAAAAVEQQGRIHQGLVTLEHAIISLAILAADCCLSCPSFFGSLNFCLAVHTVSCKPGTSRALWTLSPRVYVP